MTDTTNQPGVGDKETLEGLSLALDKRLVLQQLYTRVVRDLVVQPIEVLDQTIDTAIRRIGEFLGADRSYVFRSDDTTRTMSNSHEWCAEGVSPEIDNLQDIPWDFLPWWMTQLRQLQTIDVPVVADMPEAAAAEREILESQGIQSVAVVPLHSGDQLIGFVGFDAVKQQRVWEGDILSTLRLVGDSIVSSLQRREALDDLKRSELKYRELFDNSLELVQSVAPDGTFEYVNPAWLRTLEQTAAGLVGKTFWSFVHPSATAGQRGVFDRVMAGEAARDVKLDLVTPSGKRVLLEGNSVPRVLGDQVVGVQSFYQDVTERRLLEESLRHAQKLESVGRLAGGVAHDFRNILTGIGGFADSALKGLGDDHPVREDLREIAHLTERAEGLTRQLLAFSRRQPIEPVGVEIDELLQGLQRMIGRLIGEHIRLNAEWGAPGGTVFADPGQMEQVIVNLVVNAKDAMPAGGELTLSTRPVRLEMEMSTATGSLPAGDYLCISVADTGFGMDDLTRERMFEPFFTTKGIGKGTGLGLAMCYGIMQQHKGHIRVTTEQGSGTTFELYLPSVAIPAAVRPAKTAGRTAGGTETILVVEDEASILKLVSRFLTEAGYKVFEASSAETAVPLFTRNQRKIDMLLTDLSMPGATGRQLYEELSFHQPGLRVLLMSAYIDIEAVTDHVSSFELPFIEKPFGREELLLRIRSILDARWPE